jgi:hypothetical protein
MTRYSDHWTHKKNQQQQNKTKQNIYLYIPPSCFDHKPNPTYFEIIFIVAYISVCFKSHVRLPIHVGQSVMKKWNSKVFVKFGFTSTMDWKKI